MNAPLLLPLVGVFYFVAVVVAVAAIVALHGCDAAMSDICSSRACLLVCEA